MKITATKDGPYLVPTGGRAAVDGEVIEKAQVALCRCGHSQNKPFCDGSHKAAGFEAPAVTIELELG